MKLLFLFEISGTTAVIVLIIVLLWLAYQLKGKIPFGCALVAILFTIFCVKTCLELDEEEKMERIRSEQIQKNIEEEKKSLELKKQQRKAAEAVQQR